MSVTSGNLPLALSVEKRVKHKSDDEDCECSSADTEVPRIRSLICEAGMYFGTL